MDIKEIIKWALQHRWWFVVSVVLCLMIGGIRYVLTPPQFDVEAVLMLRQNDNSSHQNEMMNMMGFEGNKLAGDEVRVLTSRDLMGQVVDTLGLTTTYSVKGKRLWKEQFPQHDLNVHLSETCLDRVQVTVRVKEDKYVVRIKKGRFHREKYAVTTLFQPIQTAMGEISLSLPDTIHKGTYRAIILPRIAAVDSELKRTTVNRLSRESNIITLSMKTSCPERATATLNTLLDIYNLGSASDKNRLAIQTEQFLAARLDVVAAELDMAEADLAAYSRTHRIADLEKEAENYREMSDNYEQQIANVTAEHRVLDFLAEQLFKPENAYAVIPGAIGVSDQTLQMLIQDYNSHVVHRNTLLQTATETNPVVVQETQILNQKRAGIISGIDQCRQTLELRRQHVEEQQNQYNGRLESIPETERQYLEMLRDKQTKEKQYLYLVEKREENAMLLASDAVPVKVVQRAQMDPNKLSPKITRIGLMAILIGLCLPLCFYFLGILRKEYL